MWRGGDQQTLNIKTFIMVEIFSQEIFFVSDVGYQVMYICSFPQEKRQNMPQYFSYETKNIFYRRMYSVYSRINTYRQILHYRTQILYVQGTIFTTLIMITRYTHIYIILNISTYMMHIQTYYELTTSGIEPTNMRLTIRRANHEATHTYIIY